MMPHNYRVRRSLLGKLEVHYPCTSCKADLVAPLDEAGTTSTCPACGRNATVPGEVEKREFQAQAQEQVRRAAEEQLAKEQAALQRKKARQAPKADQGEGEVDELRAVGPADHVLRMAFKLARVISVMVVFACVAVAGWAVYQALTIKAEVPRASAVQRTPTLADFLRTKAPSKDTPEPPVALLDSLKAVAPTPAQEIEAQYRDRINLLITTYRLKASIYRNIVADLVALRSTDREPYMKGLEQILAAIRAQNAQVDDAEVAHWFMGEWRSRAELLKMTAQEEEVERRLAEMVAKDRRRDAWMVAGLSLAGLVAFIVIPLLIQIERNSRMLLYR